MSSIAPFAPHQQQEMMGEETTILDPHLLRTIRTGLPKGYSLEMIVSAQSLALVHANGPCIVHLERFTKTEWRVLLVLCHAYPLYCPYSTLLTAINTPSMQKGNASIARIPPHGIVSVECDPMRSTLYRLRRKLAPFHITLISVNTVGYYLAPIETQTRQNKGEKEEEDQHEQ